MGSEQPARQLQQSVRPSCWTHGAQLLHVTDICRGKAPEVMGNSLLQDIQGKDEKRQKLLLRYLIALLVCSTCSHSPDMWCNDAHVSMVDPQ